MHQCSLEEGSSLCHKPGKPHMAAQEVLNYRANPAHPYHQFGKPGCRVRVAPGASFLV